MAVVKVLVRVEYHYYYFYFLFIIKDKAQGQTLLKEDSQNNKKVGLTVASISVVVVLEV